MHNHFLPYDGTGRVCADDERLQHADERRQRVAAENCMPPIMCSAAKQELPVDCRNATRTCSGGIVIAPDQRACSECGLTNERLGVKNTPIAACACAHCAAQIAACFDSAKTDPDGGARDALCQSDRGMWLGEPMCRRRMLLRRRRRPCHLLAGRKQWASARAVRQDDRRRRTHAGRNTMTSASIGDCVLGNQLTDDSILARATAVAQCVTGDPLLRNGAIEAQCPLDGGVP